MGRLWKSGARKNRNPKPLKRAPTAHGRRAAGPSNYRRMKRVGMLRPTARAAVEARLAESGKRQVVATHQASYDHMVRDLKALQAEERELAIQGTLSMGTNRYNQVIAEIRRLQALLPQARRMLAEERRGVTDLLTGHPSFEDVLSRRTIQGDALLRELAKIRKEFR